MTLCIRKIGNVEGLTPCAAKAGSGFCGCIGLIHISSNEKPAVRRGLMCRVKRPAPYQKPGLSHSGVDFCCSPVARKPLD